MELELYTTKIVTVLSDRSSVTVRLAFTCEVGCVLPTVIWPKLRPGWKNRFQKSGQS